MSTVLAANGYPLAFAESNQNQESSTREGNSRIQVHRSAAVHQKSLRNPTPQPTKTGNTHRLQVRHHAKISTGQT